MPSNCVFCEGQAAKLKAPVLDLYCPVRIDHLAAQHAQHACRVAVGLTSTQF